MLLFKPQLTLGIGLLWLLEWRTSWKSLLGLVVGGGILAGLSFWLLPDASLAYVNLVRNFIPRMLYQPDFPLWHLHSLRGFWTLLLPNHTSLVEILSFIFSAAGVVAFIYLWRSTHPDRKLLFAATICLTIWITPHAMIYDWSILLVSAILFWQSLPELKSLWKSLFALIWIATFISGPLTFMQLKISPIAFQLSIPVYLFCLFFIYQMIKRHPGVNIENESRKSPLG